MSSTFSTSLKLELIGNGDQSGVWGQTTNNNLNLVSQAITGVQSIVMLNTDYTLTNLNGVTDEARNAVLVVTGTNSAIRNIIAPTAQPKTYTVFNNTTGGYAINIKTASGTAVAIPNGFAYAVYTDGTNFFSTSTAYAATAGSATTATNATNAAYLVTASGNIVAAGPDIGVFTNGSFVVNNLAGSFYKLSVDSSGNTVITANMDCASASITSTAPTLSLRDTNGLDFSVHVNSDTWYVLNQSANGVIYTDQAGNFTAAGNVTAYSDERLKSDIKTLPAALDTIDQLRGVSFIKDGQANIGVIAQEVQKVLPQVVQENKDGYLSVAYGNLVGVLIEAVKELRAEVNALKGK